MSDPIMRETDKTANIDIIGSLAIMLAAQDQARRARQLYACDHCGHTCRRCITHAEEQARTYLTIDTLPEPHQTPDYQPEPVPAALEWLAHKHEPIRWLLELPADQRAWYQHPDRQQAFARIFPEINATELMLALDPNLYTIMGAA